MGLSSSLDAPYLCGCLLLAPFCESTLEGGGSSQSWGRIHVTGAGVSATGAGGCCDFQGPICRPAHSAELSSYSS